MTTALHPIPIAVPLPTGIHPGALVMYRGRRHLGEEYTVFYVTDVDADTNRVTIVDRDYPGVTTLRVSTLVVRPTGVTVDLCGCGHEQGRQRTGRADVCDAHPACTCLKHPIRDED